MTTTVVLDTPEQLRELMGVDWVFSDEQFAAITAPLEPAVVIAGAGSGKTAVMAARVIWLVATGRVSPSEVLGLTFTTKAAGELQRRVREGLRGAGLLPEEAADEDEPTVATYHSYAAELLTENGLRIGHEPDTRLVADAGRYQLAARVVQRHARPIVHLTDAPQLAVQYLLSLDAELSEHLVTPAQVRAYDAAERPRFEAGMETEHRKTYREKNEKAILAVDRRAELLGLVEDYRALKARLGLMDFSDQIALAARLAQEHPEVGAAERERFRVVLLDEYQDTSVAQALMLSRLFSGPTPEAGRGHPVMAVGDPNQAIYGWRGASVSNILDFGADFPPASGATARYTLTVNRRSDERILAVANHLATPLYEGREHDRLRPQPGAEAGEVRLAVHETLDDELDWLAEQVLASHEAMDGPSWREIGVLTRDNAHAALVFDALTRREVPVEIVGLKGLLRLPEVAEIVATLTLLQDVTANAALLTLLGGARWAIGLRDLALLGRRSRELAGDGSRGQQLEDLEAQFAAVADGADPIELPSLTDALDDPGDLPYSREARERFGLLSAELRALRRAAGEPLLDLVRRIVEVTGIDVELASSVSPAAAARRENLDLFLQAVAQFQPVDGQVTLSALLAWLEAEDEFGQGLDVATPSEADSVKLLTVHRAKGLEWDVVFVVGVTDRKFPTSQGRSSWLTVPYVMPAALRGDARDLPQLGGHLPADLDDLAKRRKAHEAVEELRLAYVAWTRARHRLFVSSWRWSPNLKGGRGPSPYALLTREAMAGWGAEPDRWGELVGKDEPNPYDGTPSDLPWPLDHRTAEVERRQEAARRVREASAVPPPEIDDLLVLERIQQWDDDLGRLVEEASRDAAPEIVVPRPSHLSATALTRLEADPEAFVRDLARPMPRRPSRAARFGTRFHAWVETQFGQQDLFDYDDLPGRADAGIADEADLQELIAAFSAGQFAGRVPHAVEAPFEILLGGQVVRGRIDAVYRDGDEYLVVDWKTGSEAADPLQLAVYRLAWAELQGVPIARVRAAFYYVRTGRFDEPAGLPGRVEVEASLSHAATPRAANRPARLAPIVEADGP